MHRGVMGTAVAALAMAALTASQAPGLAHPPQASAQEKPTPPSGPAITGDSPYYTDLPPLVTPGKPDTSVDLPSSGPESGTGPIASSGRGIPATVLAAYKTAEAELAATKPGCNLPWELLAAIGQVESNHARGGNVDLDGTTVSPILGPQLNGVGFANILDTDNGAYDGDTTHDRAVGPMQFIPSTWINWGADGNADGKADPNNIYDAALAAGTYLCAGNRDLSDPAQMDAAILGYNRSQEYLHTVRSWYDYFRDGAVQQIPDSPGNPSPEPTSSADADGKDKDKDKDGGKGKGDGKGKGGKGSASPSATPTKTPKPTPTKTGDGSVKPTPTKTGGGTISPSPTGTTTSPDPTCTSPSQSESPSASESPSTLPEFNGSPTQASAAAALAASEGGSTDPSQTPEPCASPSAPEDDDDTKEPSPGLIASPTP